MAPFHFIPPDPPVWVDDYKTPGDFIKDPPVWVDDYKTPGDFIKAFLSPTFGNDDDDVDDVDDGKQAIVGDCCGRARSRSRSQPQPNRMPKEKAPATTASSPQVASVTSQPAAPRSRPLPKRMPRIRPPSRPTEESAATLPGPPAGPPLPPLAHRNRRRIEDAHPAPPSCGRPLQSSWPAAPSSQAPATDSQLAAVAVLARHAARLGGAAGRGLEAAVRALLRRADTHSVESAVLFHRFSFLDDPCVFPYVDAKAVIAQVYLQHGSGRPETDRLVLSRFSEGGLGIFAVPPLPSPSVRVLRHPFAEPGATIDLHPEEVCFAHDAQSELFGGARDGPEPRCILQTAIEIAAGVTRVDALPAFTVCRHDGRWFCRSGNRRLAALRLARRFRPESCARLRVKVVGADEGFLYGTWNRGPKLTTQRNGNDCGGRWLVVRETGEAVGWEEPDCAEYGADLMALLFSF